MRTFPMTVLFTASLLLAGLSPAAAAETVPCGAVNDSFDRLDPARWAEVLLLSPSRGTVRVDKGRLLLTATDAKPHEIQVYSLFTLSGDFDVQVAYQFPAEKDAISPCRFNSGIVAQTLDDRLTYKGYVASKPERELIFRSRLDRHGEENIEKFQTRPAPANGILRLTRRDGRMVFRTWDGKDWRVTYPFSERCTEKMRVRFKLQTGGDAGAEQSCPVTVAFDDFQVNHCETVTLE
jgi:hypothetical protein